MAVLIDAIFGFPLHLPATLILFWLFIGFIISIKYSGQETKIEEKKKLEPKAKSDRTDSNIYKFKPLLYLVIILLALFFCVIIVRPFVAQIYQYYGVQYAKNADYDTAGKNFQEALKWNPYFGVMYYSLGQIISQKGIYTPAIENFEKAERYIGHPDLPG